MSSRDGAGWHAPRELVEPLSEAVGGFDMDPAPREERESAVADQPFADRSEALEREWHGRVWAVPSGSMAEWSRKCALESRREGVELIVAVVRGDTSTEWWHENALAADAIGLLEGRIAFGDRDSSAQHASHVLIYGRPPRELVAELSVRGAVFPTAALFSYATEETAQAALSSFLTAGDRSVTGERSAE